MLRFVWTLDCLPTDIVCRLFRCKGRQCGKSCTYVPRNRRGVTISKFH